jgi:glutamate N-acetyltransferase/amino-acid N-acetyltransferase
LTLYACFAQYIGIANLFVWENAMKKIRCPGFLFSGVEAGIKKKGGKDLGLIYSEVPANAAGLFTRNRVQAAPVRIDRERIQSGSCQAVIVNSGNANCCTGDQGLRDARAMSKAAAGELGISEDSVLVSSTGVIGEPLPIEKIESAVPVLVKSADSGGIYNLAEAIMTTDTVPKVVSRQGQIDDRVFTVIGVAKGSGMIRPDLATLLCFLVSDISASPELLKKMLVASIDISLNRITIDGDTSTNDTVLLLTNGTSDITVKSSAHKKIFQRVLDDVLFKLAKLLVTDGEGATKLVEIIVKGAETDKDARQVADTVAHSNLVKTALFGEDANWGRILAAAGRAGVKIDPDKIDIYFDAVRMVSRGVGCGRSAEAMDGHSYIRVTFRLIMSK